MNIITNNQFFTKRSIAIGIGVITIIVLVAVFILNNPKAHEQNPRLHNFERYGFSLLVPESFDDVVCNNENMFVASDTVEKPEFSAFCKNDSTRSAPFVMVGWKPKVLENAEFSKKIMAYFTGKFFGEGKKFNYTCDNKTGMVTAVGSGIGARAFSCAVVVDGGKSFTAIYYIFYTGKNADTTNWIIMTDVANPGSTSKEKMILLAKGIKLEVRQKQSMMINAFIQTVHADPSDGDGAEGGAGGEGPSGGNGTGSLGSDTSTSGTVSDSFGGTVGSGCGGCASGPGDGSGSGSGSGAGVVSGTCSVAHYNCSTGTSADNVSAISTWTWTCNGSGGGSNASCSESKPTPTGTLQASPISCQIATGASSCQSTLTWTTANPQGTSGITRDGTAGLLFSGNNDTKVTNVPYEADGSVTYRLYNNGTELGNATIAVTCESGKYDSSSGKCADPRVDSAVVGGEYYPPGTITLTCSNASTYSVTLDGNPFIAETAYSGPVTIQNVMQEGNYVIKCIQGTVVDQVTRFYDATPPASTIQLEVSPVTIGKDGRTTVSWKTKFPANTCNLTAKVVCPNNACTAAQTSFETSLNSKLQTEKTDVNDPASSRLITTAVKTVAPGHLGIDWLALGRKTLQISYTTDMVYDCGNGNKTTKRIQVTKSELQ